MLHATVAADATYTHHGELSPSTTAQAIGDLGPVQLAYVTFLGQYHGNTLEVYRHWLDRYLAWCLDNGLDPMAVKRAHVELYVRWLLVDGGKRKKGLAASTVNTALTPVRLFYGDACDEELIDRDPTRKLKLPKYQYEKSKILPYRDLILFLETAKATSPRHWALCSALCGMALRISEASSLRVESYLDNVEQGHHILHYVQKGGARQATPVPMPVLHAFEAARDGRTVGPLIAARDGHQLTRHGAAGLIETVNRRAAKQGLKRHINPHLLRKAAITEAFEMGMSTRDVQAFARHADPRTTSRHYDLGRDNHYRHPVHQIAGRVAV